MRNLNLDLSTIVLFALENYNIVWDLTSWKDIKLSLMSVKNLGEDSPLISVWAGLGKDTKIWMLNLLSTHLVLVLFSKPS